MRKLIPNIIALVFVLFVVYLLVNSRSSEFDSPEAASEFHEIGDKDLPALAQEIEPELAESISLVMDRFARSRDVSYTAPHSGISILHIACLFKKPALVQSLLQAGADPNAHHPDDDSPLLLAVGTYMVAADTAKINTLVDTLLEGGAVFAKSGSNESDFLTQAAFVCEDEAVLLHLMERGAKPDADSALPPALHGWAKLLAQMPPDTLRTPGLLQAAALGSCRHQGQHIECIDMLLAAGADVNDTAGADISGGTPLFCIAQELSALDPDSPLRSHGMDTLAHLLERGADPYLRSMQDENYPGFCAYDFLAMRPGLLEDLAQRGHPLQAPPLHFSPGSPILPAEICRTAPAHPSAELLAPHFDAIASVFYPSAAMRQQELYPQAVEAAVALLAAVDPARAAECIQSSPLWQDANEPALSALLTALRDTPAIRVDKDFLCRQAETWAQAGHLDEAATAAELLGHSADAEATIELYAHSEHPALQAGALAARLREKELPDARNNGVADWLLRHRREADTPFLQEAVLLTSLERLWYGEMPEAEVQSLVTLMRRIGAPQAAELYEQIARHLDDPDKLDTLLRSSDTRKFELEVATARYFLENQAQFITPKS